MLKMMAFLMSLLLGLAIIGISEAAENSTEDEVQSYYFYQSRNENGSIVELGGDSLLEFPFNESVVGKSSESLSVCLRFTMTYGIPVGLISELAGLSIVISNPKEGYGFVEFQDGDFAVFYMFFVSKKELPIQQFHNLCFSLINQQTPQGSRMTKFKLYNNGELFCDSFFEGNNAIPMNFVINQKFLLGGMFLDKLRFRRHQGVLTDVNIWTSALSDQEMISFTNSVDQGRSVALDTRVFSWETYDHEAMDKHKNGSVKIPIETKYMRRDIEFTEHILIAINLPFNLARDLCTLMGGVLPMADNMEEHQANMKKMQNPTYQIGEEDCNTRRWTPIVQDISPGFVPHADPKLTNTYTYHWIYDSLNTLEPVDIYGEKEKATFLPFQSGQPNGLHLQRCTDVEVFNGKMFDTNCDSDLHCAVCDVNREIDFTLRGLSDELGIERHYRLNFNDLLIASSTLKFTGNNGQILTWNLKTDEMMIEDHLIILKKKNGQSSPFGLNKALLIKTNETTHVKFSRCDGMKQFTCNYGGCIDLELRCDGTKDCRDGSDEAYCKILIPDGSHKKDVPINAESEVDFVTVDVGFYINSISNLDEVEQTMMTSFQLWVAWKDHRLGYENLNDDYLTNLIDEDVAKQLWIPPLVFETSKSEGSYLYYDSLSLLGVMKEKEPEHGSIDTVHETYKFSGHSNRLIFTRSFDMVQSCDFDLTYFPFDTQVCSINVTVAMVFKDRVRPRIPYKYWITYLGKKYLNQFEVIETKGIVQGDNSTIQVNIVLKRLVENHMLATFFPTVCLMIIGCLTLFIDQRHFEATIMVSLTTMLVTYTLYQSISQSLPKTGTIKLVDVWLLVGLVLPFVVFLCLVLVEVLPENISNRNITLVAPGPKGTQKSSIMKRPWAIKKNFIKWARISITASSFFFGLSFFAVALSYYNKS